MNRIVCIKNGSRAYQQRYPLSLDARMFSTTTADIHTLSSLCSLSLLNVSQWIRFRGLRSRVLKAYISQRFHNETRRVFKDYKNYAELSLIAISVQPFDFSHGPCLSAISIGKFKFSSVLLFERRKQEKEGFTCSEHNRVSESHQKGLNGRRFMDLKTINRKLRVKSLKWSPTITPVVICEGG